MDKLLGLDKIAPISRALTEIPVLDNSTHQTRPVYESCSLKFEYEKLEMTEKGILKCEVVSVEILRLLDALIESLGGPVTSKFDIDAIDGNFFMKEGHSK